MAMREQTSGDGGGSNAASGHSTTNASAEQQRPISVSEAPPSLGGERAAAAAPLWVAVCYFAGLVLLYLGQRVILSPEWAALSLSALGALSFIGSTLMRGLLLGRSKTSGNTAQGAREHSQVGQLLTGLQVLGLIGVGLYFLAGEWGASRLGIDDSEQLSNVQSVLRVIWTLLIAISVSGLFFAEVALNPMRNAAHLEGGRVRMAALSGVVLALAGGYGSLFVYAAAQTGSQADFSYFKTSEPGESTVKLVQKMAEPVKVTGFFPQVNGVRKEVNTYLQRLKQKAGNLEIRMVDRYLEPKLAKELKVVADGALVLSHGEATEKLVIGTELSNVRDKLKALDKNFNTQLYKLLRSRRTAYLTSGHGELNDPDRGAKRSEGRSATIFKKILEQQNYKLKDLGLAQGLASEVPDDAAMVVVLGPTLPFAPEEIASLKRYAQAGGKVLMALDTDGQSEQQLIAADSELTHHLKPGAADTPATPAGEPREDALDGAANHSKKDSGGSSAEYAWLVDLAGAVGADYQPVTVADDKKYYPRRRNPSDHVILYSNRFSTHASVSTLSRNASRAVVMFNGAGYLLKDEAAAVRTEPTVRTFSSAFADKNGNFLQDADEQTESFNLGVALTRKAKVAESGANESASPGDGKAGADTPTQHAQTGSKPDPESQQGDEDPEMRAFVLADADVVSDLFMANFPANQMLAFDALRWLGGEESLAGEVESEEDVRIEHTQQKDLVWFYSTIFGVPLGVLAVGLVISRRGRRGGKKSRNGGEK